MKSLSLRLEDIVIGERHRALSEDAVQRLATSISDIGLMQPIGVRIVEEMMLEGHLTAGVPVLVAGGHRLAAAKSLGWLEIDCVEVVDDDITAELWEIAENLHRHDLTKDQRDQHIRRYAELIEAKREVSRQNDAKPASSPQGGRPEGVAREVARDTGLSVRTVQRALAPAPASKPQLVEVKDDFDVIGSQADAIVRAWNRACPEARQMAMEQIDGPVMDNARAEARG